MMMTWWWWWWQWWFFWFLCASPTHDNDEWKPARWTREHVTLMERCNGHSIRWENGLLYCTYIQPTCDYLSYMPHRPLRRQKPYQHENQPPHHNKIKWEARSHTIRKLAASASWWWCSMVQPLQRIRWPTTMMMTSTAEKLYIWKFNSNHNNPAHTFAKCPRSN